MKPPAAVPIAALVLLLSGRSAGGSDFEVEPLRRSAAFQREVLVLDRVTRSPIPGARIRRYAEMSVPRAVFLSAFATGPDGRAVVEAGDWREDTHWLADAPGYAPAHSYGVLPHDEVFELGPPRPFEAVVLDGLGRPIPGALLDAYEGCGHAPSMQVAAADGAGRVALSGIDPRSAILWPEAPGFVSDYVDLGSHGTLDGRTGDWALVLQPGGVCEGVVRDGDGRPLQGAVLRVTNRDRGPEAVTGPDGRFRLVGGPEGGSLRLAHPYGRDDTELGAEDGGEWRSGFPLRLDLTPWGLAGEEAGPPRRVQLEFTGPAGAAAPASVSLVRRDDGRAYEVLLPQQELEDGLAPGRYAVLDAPGEPRGLDPVEVEVVPGEGAQILRLRLRSLARLRVGGAVPADASVTLALPWREEIPEPEIPPATWEPPIEEDAPAALRVGWLGAQFFFEVGPARDGRRAVDVRLPEPHRLRIRRAEGAAPWTEEGEDPVRLLRGGMEVPAELHDGELRTYAAGSLVLVVRDRGLLHELPVALPSGGGGTHEVVLPSEAAQDRRRVLVRIAAAGAAPVLVTVRDRLGDVVLHEVPYDEGAPPAFLLHERATLEVRGAGLPTRVVAVEAPGEVRVAWGSASLRIEARTADGRPVADARIGRDRFRPGEDGAFEIRGLDPGPVEIDLLPEEPWEGVRLRTTLRAGETAVHALTLPVASDDEGD